MNIKASWTKYTLKFRFDAGTSRGVLREKDTWYIKVWNASDPSVAGLGECGPLKGLSIDDRPDYEPFLDKVVTELPALVQPDLTLKDTALFNEFPSVRFGLETALRDLGLGGKRMLVDNGFFHGRLGIRINGLVWMGDKEFMEKQVREKLEAGYNCIKIKVGAIDFESECRILAGIREKYSPEQITLRLDANGAFSLSEANEKLKELSRFGIHSIEQPVKSGQAEAMAELCRVSPIPVALDEELIGIYSMEAKRNLLEAIKPPYIIIKPSLLGGVAASQEWIAQASAMNIGFWITSALESNIGLNAIAQFTSTFDTDFPQGLGTGQLYYNNHNSPLVIRKGYLHYDPSLQWDLSFFNS